MANLSEETKKTITEINKLLSEENLQFDQLLDKHEKLLNNIHSYETSWERVKRYQNDANESMTEYKKLLNDNGYQNIEELSNKIKDNTELLKKLKKEQEELNKKQEERKSKGRIHTKIFAKDEKKLQNKNKEVEDINKKIKEQIDLKNKSQEPLRKIIKLQEELNKRQEEGVTILNDWEESLNKNTKAFRKGVGMIGEGVKKTGKSVWNILEPWRKANHEAMAYAKTIGMSQKTADTYLSNTVSWAAKNDIGLLFNKTTDELIKMQSKYSEVLGRNVQLTSEQKKDMLAMETFLGEDGMMDIANNLENFGLGMSDSADFVKKTLDDATKSGIAASKLTKTIRENIKMAQNYTFKNGLDSLTSMAKKAIQLKTDMSFVNGFLEKTSTVEGAITTGAQLQVLGGNYALGSDPLSMMYESLNDMEGLFDRVVGMAQGKVFYNNATGNFEMGAMDRYMMKQAATAMGVDPSKMIDVAFRKASLDKIEEQIKANSDISGDAEMVEMVKNLATWDKGKGIININGKDKEISKLDVSDKAYLEQMQKTDSQNLQEMAINLRSINDIISGVDKETKNNQANIVKPIGEKLDEYLKNHTKMLDSVSKILSWTNILNHSMIGIYGIWTTLKGLGTMSVGGQNILTNGKPMTGKRSSIRGVGKFTELLKKANTPASKKALSKIAGGVVKRTVGAGVLSGALSLGTSAMTGELQKDTGFALARAGVSTAAGAIGTFFGGPFVGMLCSTLADGATRLVQEGIKKQRQKLRDEIANKLSSTNPEIAGLFSGDNALQGNYSKKGLRKIEQSLSDGVLDENDNLGRLTIRKLRKNDDLERMSKAGIDVRIPLASGGYLEGKSHIEGGMPILGSNISVEGGEFVINKEATKRNLPLLNEINNGNFQMSAREPLGKILKVKNHGYTDGVNMPHNSKMKIEPISINLSGTIKLDGGNKQVDISNEILNNPQLITKLTEMINKQLNILDNGAYNKGIFRQRFS